MSKILLRLAAGATASLALAHSAYAVNLKKVATDFNNPIGVDYHAPTNSLILSVNYPSGNPNSLDLVSPNGTHTPFSNLSGLSDEVYIATARTTANGFLAGQVFVGNGVPGQIVRISPDGATVNNPWVDLATGFGESGLFRGALHQDTTGEWGGDLIVATTSGNVYRINSAGGATFVGSAGHIIEGIVTVPNNAARYGPWAGKILTGNDSNLLYTFTHSGFDQAWNLGFFATTENVQIPNAGDTFYGVDFAEGTLVSGSPAEMAPYTGDVIVGDENGNLFDLKWNGTSFDHTLLAQVAQFEGATFAPVQLPTSCKDLGPAKPFNVFAENNFTAHWSDVQGAAAAGGNFTTQGYSVGDLLGAGANALVVGGNTNFSQGTIYGNLCAGGSASLSSATLKGSQIAGTCGTDFASAPATLAATSDALATVAANGTTTLQWGGIYLTGSDPTLNVFSVPAAAAGSTWGFNFNVPAGSHVLINITGSGAMQLRNFGWNSAPAAGKVLVNLPGATSLGIGGVGLVASVLAPRADTQFDNGNIKGQLVVKSFAGQGQMNLGPFDTCIDTP